MAPARTYLLPLMAAVAAVRAASFGDFAPDCAVDCFNTAVDENSTCEADDTTCICADIYSLKRHSQVCLEDACDDADYGAAMLGYDNFCKGGDGGSSSSSSSAPASSTEAAPTSSSSSSSASAEPTTSAEATTSASSSASTSAPAPSSTDDGVMSIPEGTTYHITNSQPTSTPATATTPGSSSAGTPGSGTTLTSTAFATPTGGSGDGSDGGSDGGDDGSDSTPSPSSTDTPPNAGARFGFSVAAAVGGLVAAAYVAL